MVTIFVSDDALETIAGVKVPKYGLKNGETGYQMYLDCDSVLKLAVEGIDSDK